MKDTHTGAEYYVMATRRGYSKTENLQETHLALPSELQALLKLEGNLTIADGTPPARVKIEPKVYLEQAERFVPRV